MGVYRRPPRSDELYHFGVLGMKWGVRRYQNPDGSLTDAGRKHYGKMSSRQLRKALKKQVQSKRAQVHGSGNRWMRNTYIGENSKRVIDQEGANRAAYENSQEYREWRKKVSKLERKYDNYDLYDQSERNRLNKQWDTLAKQRPKENYNSLSYVKVNGAFSDKSYLDKAGKDLSIAYLQDLGYNRHTAEELVKKMRKGALTLGDA